MEHRNPPVYAYARVDRGIPEAFDRLTHALHRLGLEIDPDYLSEIVEWEDGLTGGRRTLRWRIRNTTAPEDATA